MYKRFYWSGSRAVFHAIHWYGFESQGAVGISDFSPNYHVNVENAFATAFDLADYTWYFRARTVFVAHSLGNMLASAAISRHNAYVSDYVLLNAAVPLEAYGDDSCRLENLVHPEWRPYVSAGQERLLCSEWHTLFDDPQDPRGALTWRGIFSDMRGVSLHPFYSRGEEVVNAPPAHLLNLEIGWNKGPEITFTSPDDYAWATQELWKGRSYELWGDGYFTGSRLMGWGFNRRGYEHWIDVFSIFGMPSPEKAGRDISNVDLIRKPFFRKRPAELFSDNDQTAQDYASTHRLRLLARTIPARTQGAGGAEASIDVFPSSIDMNGSEMRNGWFRTEGKTPNTWKHSDIKNMPFINVKPVFEHIVNGCDLKGNTP